MSSNILSAQTQSIHSYPTIWVNSFTILCPILRSFLQIITSPRVCFSSHSLTHLVCQWGSVFRCTPKPCGARATLHLIDKEAEQKGEVSHWPGVWQTIWLQSLALNPHTEDQGWTSPFSKFSKTSIGQDDSCYTVRIYTVLYWSYTKLYWYVLVFYMWPIWL